MGKRFILEQIENGQRWGNVVTRRGTYATPFFMPDATRAAVRGLTVSDVRTVGVGPMVVNTYHLMLQPGAALIAEAGGLHAFMGWDDFLLSDSGGYQVYSLIHKQRKLGKITEAGAEFRSTLDGSLHLLTPERSIQIQFDFGVDALVCLDDPRPNDIAHEEAAAAVERTLRWARRCRDEYDRQVSARGLTQATRPLLFGVVQGGLFVELRQRCAVGLVRIGFDGYGFGGRHVDEAGHFLEEIVTETAAAIPQEALRFALGIGTPSDIVRCFASGWDMFDCVIPTREGRHGRLFISNIKNRISKNESSPDSLFQIPDFYQTINIRNEKFERDFAPIDSNCACELCRGYSRAYLHHLFRVGDPLGGRLAALHNLAFYQGLMRRLRAEKQKAPDPQ